MLSTFSHDRLAAAHRAALEQLARARDVRGCWAGVLSSSPLATAAAISALALAERNVDSAPDGLDPLHDSWLGGVLMRTELNELVGSGLRWLADQQNPDGGWADAKPGRSNLVTTMAVEAAFHLTGVPAKCANMMERARAFIAEEGGAAALRDHRGPRRTVAAGVLALHAAASLTPWSKTPCRWATLVLFGAGRRSRDTAGSVADEILRTAVAVARGANLQRFHPLRGAVSGAARSHALAFLQSKQSSAGGFLDSPAITALVAGALASAGLADAALVRQAVEFLLSTVRGDGSWPACVDTAVRDTTAALAGSQWHDQLFAPRNELSDVAAAESHGPSVEAERTMRWLLDAQRTSTRVRGGRKRLGWASTCRPDGASSVYDTAGALMALASWRRRWPNALPAEVRQAAFAGLDWLIGAVLSTARYSGLSLWPLFGARSRLFKLDVAATAQALRAMFQWRQLIHRDTAGSFDTRLQKAMSWGVKQLIAAQREDGSWSADGRRTGSIEQASHAVASTAAALQACAELGLVEQEPVLRAARWLAGAQHACGGWGPAPRQSGSYARKRDAVQAEAEAARCTIEETAAAIAALAPFAADSLCEKALAVGAEWLAEAMLADARCAPATMSLAWSRLWYHDSLAAPVAAVAALGRVTSAGPAAAETIPAR